MRNARGVTVTELILFILLALLLAVVAWRQDDWNLGVRILLMLAAILFLALAIVAAAMWVQFHLAVVDEQRAKAAAYSERVRFALALSGLNPEQLAGISKYMPAYEVISGTGGPVYLWRCIGGDLIDQDFLREYVNRGDDDYLYPVRNLDETDREMAMRFISDAAQRGWCELPAGNRPARWLKKDEALRQMFGAAF